MKKFFSRVDRSVLGQWWWTVDRALLAALAAIIVSGIILVAAASPPVAQRIGLNEFHFLYRHIVFLIPALGAMFAFSLCTPKLVWRLCSVFFIGGIAALILVLVGGAEVKGAQRWLSLFGFSLQPSEFVKPAFAVCSAWFLARFKEDSRFPGHYVAAGLYALVAALLLMQPDLGMTVVMSVIFGAQIFLAGFPIALIVALGMAAAIGLTGSYFFFDHVRSRIDRFIDPASGDTYQIDKALEAFREGGLFGAGLGQGTVKLTIPDSHADFIFAVAGEEMGMIFAVILVALFAFIIMRGFSRILDSNDMFIMLAGSGLLASVGIQALIHMASSTHLMPTKGMTLPFVSYGGSSLVAVGMTMGMILSFTRRQRKFSSFRGGAIARGGLATGPAA